METLSLGCRGAGALLRVGVTCHCTATVNHLVELVRFARALNRSVTGSINELLKFAEYMLADDDISHSMSASS